MASAGSQRAHAASAKRARSSPLCRQHPLCAGVPLADGRLAVWGVQMAPQRGRGLKLGVALAVLAAAATLVVVAQRGSARTALSEANALALAAGAVSRAQKEDIAAGGTGARFVAELRRSVNAARGGVFASVRSKGLHCRLGHARPGSSIMLRKVGVSYAMRGQNRMRAPVAIARSFRTDQTPAS